MKGTIITKKPEEMEKALQLLQKNISERMDELLSHNANLLFSWIKEVKGDQTHFNIQMTYTGENVIVNKFVITPMFKDLIAKIDSEGEYR